MLKNYQYALIALAVVAILYTIYIFVSSGDSKYEYTYDSDVEHKIDVESLDLDDLRSSVKHLTSVVSSLDRKVSTMKGDINSIKQLQGVRGEQLDYTSSSLNSLSQIVNS